VGFVLLAAACTSETAPSSSPGQQQAPPGDTNGSGGTKPKPPNVPDDPGVETFDGDPILAPNAPACTGEPGTLYELSVRQLARTDEIPLCRAKGRVLLIVNTASHCGYTVQYKPLQTLYEKYRDQGFSVLAFPSQSFNQEDSDEKVVSEFCTKEQGITFPVFAIAPVKDDPSKNETAQPVFKWLTSQPGMSTPVAWNFEKFLVGRDGKVVGRFLSAVSPDEGGEIDKAIAKAIEQK
jgi:glutathione peroxidase